MVAVKLQTANGCLLVVSAAMANKKTGRGERIRTSGLYVPNVALYQAKLHPVSRQKTSITGLCLSSGEPSVRPVYCPLDQV